MDAAVGLPAVAPVVAAALDRARDAWLTRDAAAAWKSDSPLVSHREQPVRTVLATAVAAPAVVAVVVAPVAPEPAQLAVWVDG
jgi:hypothetical protein